MNKIAKLAAALLFAVLLNVGLFTFASISLTSFWISWGFIHAAFLIWVCILIFSAPEQKKLMAAYSETAIATYYLIVEVIAGLVLMFEFALFPVMAFLLQALLLAGFAVAFFAVKKMNRSVERQENARNADLRQFKYLQESMKEVLNLVDYSAPYKKTVEHAYDALNGSPVRSSQEVYKNEETILQLIGQLKQEVEAKNEAAIPVVCQKLEREVEERNKVLRLIR